MGFKVNLDNQQIIHANSKLFFAPNYIEFVNEVRYFNEIIKKISVIYAKSINQKIFKYQTVFTARFDKQDEKNQVLDKLIAMNVNKKDSDIVIDFSLYKNQYALINKVTVFLGDLSKILYVDDV